MKAQTEVAGSIYSQTSSHHKLVLHMNSVHLTQYLHRCFFCGDSIEKSLFASTLHSSQGSQNAKAKVSLFSSIVSHCFMGVCVFVVLQEDVSFSALVQLFDPLLSPRCYAVVGLKSYGNRITSWWTCTHSHECSDSTWAPTVLQKRLCSAYLFSPAWLFAWLHLNCWIPLCSFWITLSNVFLYVLFLRRHRYHVFTVSES